LRIRGSYRSWPRDSRCGPRLYNRPARQPGRAPPRDFSDGRIIPAASADAPALRFLHRGFDLDGRQLGGGGLPDRGRFLRICFLATRCGEREMADRVQSRCCEEHHHDPAHLALLPCSRGEVAAQLLSVHRHRE
jgi:hypothetical protein